MKQLLFGICTVAALCACTQVPGYKLTGTIEGAQDGDTVKVLTYAEDWTPIVWQETVIKNGVFALEGRKDTADFYYLSCAARGELLANMQFVLENGEIVIRTQRETFDYDIKGTPANEAWCTFHNENERLCGESLDLYRASQDTTLTEEQRMQKRAQVEEKDRELTAYRVSFCKEHIDDIVGASILARYRGDFDSKELEILTKQIPEEIQIKEVQDLRAEVMNKQKTAIGQPFTDFSMATPDGKTLSVSEVAGANKVTMIDFWASWCGPCRAEMPYVKKAYAAYHDKGFEIIGVSLDNNADAWKKAIADLELPWPQISDLQGWKCAGAELYGVKAIPATVLIQDGKIIARDLREEAIAEKLAELLP